MNLLKKAKKAVKNKKGFTLVELIVVIVIILILGAALAPQVYKYISQAGRANAKNDAATVLTQLQADLAWDVAIKEGNTGDTPTGLLTAIDSNNKVKSGYTTYTSNLKLAKGASWEATFSTSSDDNSYAVTELVYITSSWICKYDANTSGSAESLWTVTKNTTGGGTTGGGTTGGTTS